MLYFKELCRRIEDLPLTVRIMSCGSSQIAEIFGGREGKWMFQTKNCFSRFWVRSNFYFLRENNCFHLYVWLYPKTQHYCRGRVL